MARSETTDSEHKAGPVTRLPWIEEVNRGSGGLRRSAGWLVALALVVVGGAYFLAVQTFNKPAAPTATPTATTPLEPQTASTASRPVASAAAPVHHKVVQQQRAQRPAAQVQLAQAKPASTATTAPSKTASTATASTSAAAKQEPAKGTAQASAKPQPAAAKPETAIAKVKSPGSHPGAVFPVVSGTVAAASAQVPRPGAPSQIDERLVQLGAFGSVDEAKRAWRAMERSYPPLKQFSASVIQNRDWNGHAFYQFQVGTASQADSEMLCQSLKHLNFRCAIVVPPWKS